MKSTIFLVMLLAFGLLFTNCSKPETTTGTSGTESSTTASSTLPVSQVITREQKVKRGEYLVTLMGCHDCHSPKMMTNKGPAVDPSRILSGHPAAEKLPEVKDKSILQGYALFSMGLTSTTGPWGTSFAANLTPDESGLGNWTLENFSTAIRKGKFKGMENGRTLFPPMPWESFRHLTDEDLGAIWAYLQSIPPVKNLVPAHIPPAG